MLFFLNIIVNIFDSSNVCLHLNATAGQHTRGFGRCRNEPNQTESIVSSHTTHSEMEHALHLLLYEPDNSITFCLYIPDEVVEKKVKPIIFIHELVLVLGYKIFIFMMMADASAEAQTTRDTVRHFILKKAVLMCCILFWMFTTVRITEKSPNKPPVFVYYCSVTITNFQKSLTFLLFHLKKVYCATVQF